MARTNSSASPGLMLFAVPAIQVVVSAPLSCQVPETWAGSAFQPGWAVRSALVSKTWALWPGPGTLCTRLPAGITTLGGEPGAADRVKASTAEAATPGEGA